MRSQPCKSLLKSTPSISTKVFQIRNHFENLSYGIKIKHTPIKIPRKSFSKCLGWNWISILVAFYSYDHTSPIKSVLPNLLEFGEHLLIKLNMCNGTDVNRTSSVSKSVLRLWVDKGQGQAGRSGTLVWQALCTQRTRVQFQTRAMLFSLKFKIL